MRATIISSPAAGQPRSPRRVEMAPSVMIVTWLTTGLTVGVWYPWWVFPVFGWGTGLAIHGWTAYRGDELSEDRIQAEIVRLLTARHMNVMVVGDDAQSIYSFRGATIRNILEFPEQFPGCRIITLEENYRSTQPILNLTNEILRRARE